MWLALLKNLDHYFYPRIDKSVLSMIFFTHKFSFFFVIHLIHSSFNWRVNSTHPISTHQFLGTSLQYPGEIIAWFFLSDYDFFP